MSECAACARYVDTIPVGPSRSLCPVCQTRLGAGDSEIEAALTPKEIEDEIRSPYEEFLRIR